MGPDIIVALGKGDEINHERPDFCRPAPHISYQFATLPPKINTLVGPLTLRPISFLTTENIPRNKKILVVF